MKYRTLGILAICLLLGAISYLVFIGRGIQDRVVDTLPSTSDSLPDSPRNVTVRLGNQEITLLDGRVDVEKEGKVLHLTQEQVVEGDLNDDGRPEAAFLLTATSDDESISATYLATAINSELGFLGTNGIPLPQYASGTELRVAQGVITLPYGTEDTLYFVLVDALLEEVVVDAGVVFSGTLVFSDDAWTFTPCSGSTKSVSSESPSFAALRAIYTTRSFDETPLFMTILATTGENAVDPFQVTRILTVPNKGMCHTATGDALDRASTTTPNDAFEETVASTTSRI